MPARVLLRTARRGQLIVLESTTYPGCTEELLLPHLLQTGLQLDVDFMLAFSPERIDPGNAHFKTDAIRAHRRRLRRRFVAEPRRHCTKRWSLRLRGQLGTRR